MLCTYGQVKYYVDHVITILCDCFHPVGEYGALACTVSALSIPQFAEIVFLRGLTMQSVVARDDKGRSRYGMVAGACVSEYGWCERYFAAVS